MNDPQNDAFFDGLLKEMKKEDIDRSIAEAYFYLNLILRGESPPCHLLSEDGMPLYIKLDMNCWGDTYDDEEYCFLCLGGLFFAMRMGRILQIGDVDYPEPFYCVDNYEKTTLLSFLDGMRSVFISSAIGELLLSLGYSLTGDDGVDYRELYGSDENSDADNTESVRDRLKKFVEINPPIAEIYQKLNTQEKAEEMPR